MQSELNAKILGGVKYKLYICSVKCKCEGMAKIKVQRDRDNNINVNEEENIFITDMSKRNNKLVRLENIYSWETEQAPSLHDIASGLVTSN